MNIKDMLEIKNAVNNLDSNEVKSYLVFILAKIKMIKDQEESLETNFTELTELYDELFKVQYKKDLWNPTPECTHVHFVVGQSFAGDMKQALKAQGWSDAHKMIVLEENYAIGPLYHLDSTEGREARSEWFRNHISEAFDFYTELEDDYQNLLQKIELIPEHAKIILWSSRSASEQIGMRHAAYLLRNRRNAVVLMDACKISEELYNRPDAFINYLHSGEVPSEKLQKALVRINEGKEQELNEIAYLVKEWENLSEQQGNLRIWSDQAVVEVPDNFYDHYLLEQLDKLNPPSGNNDFIKSARLIGEAIGYSDQHIGDSYFEYRIRELIYDGILEIKGLPAAMRYYSIRRKHKQE
ncbi:DUF1835 domain-containing protein [Neobacillus mesonae]|nr:DUF1835 domain-containing protein [Neobacillus mesonae]